MINVPSIGVSGRTEYECEALFNICMGMDPFSDGVGQYVGSGIGFVLTLRIHLFENCSKVISKPGFIPLISVSSDGGQERRHVNECSDSLGQSRPLFCRGGYVGIKLMPSSSFLISREPVETICALWD